MTTDQPIRILIVEDDEMIRLGIQFALAQVDSVVVVAEAKDGEEAIDKCYCLQPDIVLMDIAMPVLDGIEATRRIKQANHTSKIVMLTSSYSEQEVYAALSAGASGYCLKDTDLCRLKEAIQAVHFGDVWLDSAIAFKVVQLCEQKSDGDKLKGKNEQRKYLSAFERELMDLLMSGSTTSQIAQELNLPFSAAKAHVINLLNKVTASDSIKLSQEFWDPDIESCSSGDSTLQEKFEIVSRLGSGGMGTVYKARHRNLGRLFAVKLLSGLMWNDEKAQARFTKEAKITSGLIHPNIIAVHDFGISKGGHPYLIMDYINGPTLAQLIERGGPVEEKDATQLFLQIACALSYAHEHGVVHRDVKPGNILLSCEGRQGVSVKVADFGMATVESTAPLCVDRRLTQDGQAVGSPFYMSPEQCQAIDVDARSDIYSLGCVMFEVLEGAPPFRGKSPLATMNLHLNAPPPSLHKVPVSSFLNDIVQRCLRKSPSDRFASVQEIISLLVSCL